MRKLTTPLVLLSTLAVAAPATAEPVPNCAISLTIDAAEEDELMLREALATGLLGEVSEESCHGAQVNVEHDTSRLLVSLELGGQSVSREVASLHHAAMWVESWLAPPEVIPEPAAVGDQGTLERVEDPSTLFPSETADAAHRVTTRLSAEAALSLDGDLMVWAGPEIAAVALLTRSFWLGGGLGVMVWAQDDLAGVQLRGDVPVVRFAVRCGGRLFFGERLSLDLGAGLGLSLDTQVSRPVNPFAELVTTLEVSLGRGFSLIVGLFGRVHMIPGTSRLHELSSNADADDDAGDPSALSIIAGELRLGLSYTFGGRR